ncbi:MAG: hypothetical protein J0H50_10580 [Xanthomonadales bacterium]|nr:hypothetical protein [Xanthomonadales bacterium]
MNTVRARQRSHQFAQLGIRIAGVAHSFELALRFVTWAQQLRREPSAFDIECQFDVSRATSFRWLAAWRAVRGQSPQERNS